MADRTHGSEGLSPPRTLPVGLRTQGSGLRTVVFKAWSRGTLGGALAAPSDGQASRSAFHGMEVDVFDAFCRLPRQARGIEVLDV